MTLGDAHEWKARFISLDERLLRRILHVWPTCLALLPEQPEEDSITINLVALLSQDAVVRRICYFIVYQHEPFGTHTNGAKYSKGKIDLAVLLDQERERYVAYECKRLNVIHGGTRGSLATRYVRDGMMRFLTEQYAEGLPVGCMLGYVMDGDLTFATEQINGAIKANKSALGSIEELPTSQAFQGAKRFSTLHQRASTSIIELRHVLLPFKVSQAANAALPCAHAVID
ncbi:hypothetical protein [Methylosinus sp. LW3]|uniref:hypothetical protein n=1 Tax=Methylosinus sp. LW3 TaxID=107635 RepID=UPI000465CF8E|nr:hypothetical protein [Methylosinus sp. LW3]